MTQPFIPQNAEEIVLPKFPEFTKLTLDSQPVIERYTHKFPPYSDYTFPSLWCWNEGDVIELADLHDNLVVKFLDYFSKEAIFSFLGDNQLEQVLGELFEYATHDVNELPHLQLIPEHNLLHWPATLDERYSLEEDRDNYDYIYSVDELVSLSGRKYQTHRNFINRFNKAYQWETRLLNLADKTDWQAILQVVAQWKAQKTEVGMDVDVDLQALERLPILLDRVDFLAVGVYVDDVLCGYTINELNQQQYATNLFEHGDTKYSGIFRVLKQQTACQLQQRGYRYWNHQQDSGFLGLRQSKESFRPTFLKKLTIRSKSR